jgi:glycerophosphoryl diester phosphodiesterase
MTSIWAHRGSRLRAPENTMAAFALAVDEGADGIELDVHLTADGHVVVRHDPDLVMAGGGTALMRDLTLSEVRSVEPTVPELRDVFELLAPTHLILNIEAKNGPILYPGIEEALIAAHRSSGMSERLVYSSFNHVTLAALRGLDASVEIAPLYEEALVDPWIYARHLKADAAHPYFATLGWPGMIEGFREAGIAVRAWTVNAAADVRWLVGAGIDAIITDDPAAAIALRDEVEGR